MVHSWRMSACPLGTPLEVSVSNQRFADSVGSGALVSLASLGTPTMMKLGDFPHLDLAKAVWEG